MPTEERILGFSNRWYAPALASAQRVTIAGLEARLITAVLFVATKLEAFQGRGKMDYRASHDLEDIVAVVDGRAELPGEVATAPADVRTYIGDTMRHLLETAEFVEALPGFLLPDAASQARRQMVLEQLRSLAEF